MRKPWNTWLILLAVLTLAVAAMLVQTACDDQDSAAFEKRTAQALYANQKTWTDIQDLLAREKVAGRLTDDQWLQFEALDAKYRATHNSAVTAFHEYQKLKSQDNMERVTQLIADSAALIAQAQALIRAWGKGPVTIRSGPSQPDRLPAALRELNALESNVWRKRPLTEVRHVA